MKGNYMILITVEESDKQVVSGIPEYVTLELSSPATVFYTLDGTTPNSISDIYIDKIYLTYSTPTVTLKIVAVGVEETSEVLEMEWTVAIAERKRTALTGKEGINILPPGKDVVDSLAVDLDGNAARETAIEFIDLDIKASLTDSIGQPIVGESSIPFIKFPEVLRTEPVEITSLNEGVFDPQALVIMIDGYSGMSSQTVRIINRPNGTMSPISKFQLERMQYNSMVSGDFIRYMYNPNTNKVVIYYRESLDGRWIISSQRVVAKTFNLSPIGNPMVFKWVKDRSQSQLF